MTIRPHRQNFSSLPGCACLLSVVLLTALCTPSFLTYTHYGSASDKGVHNCLLVSESLRKRKDIKFGSKLVCPSLGNMDCQKSIQNFLRIGIVTEKSIH